MSVYEYLSIYKSHMFTDLYFIYTSNKISLKKHKGQNPSTHESIQENPLISRTRSTKVKKVKKTRKNKTIMSCYSCVKGV